MDGNANYLYSCILHQHRSDDHSYYFPTRCDSIQSTTSPDLYTVRYLSRFVLFLYHTPPMCLFWKPIQIPAGGKLLWRPLGPSYSHTLSPRIHCEELRRGPSGGLHLHRLPAEVLKDHQIRKQTLKLPFFKTTRRFISCTESSLQQYPTTYTVKFRK